MAKLLRIESDSLDALLNVVRKYPDLYIVGSIPKNSDGPPYVMMVRELLPEERPVTERDSQ